MSFCHASHAGSSGFACFGHTMFDHDETNRLCFFHAEYWISFPFAVAMSAIVSTWRYNLHALMRFTSIGVMSMSVAMSIIRESWLHLILVGVDFLMSSWRLEFPSPCRSSCSQFFGRWCNLVLGC